MSGPPPQHPDPGADTAPGTVAVPGTAAAPDTAAAPGTAALLELLGVPAALLGADGRVLVSVGWPGAAPGITAAELGAGGRLERRPLPGGLSVLLRPGGADPQAPDGTPDSTAPDSLERSEERYRTLADATLQYVWTNSPDGHMLGEQPGWAQLTGQEPEEYQGFGWASAIHPADLSLTLDAWKVAVADRTRYDIVHRVRGADGGYRHFRATGVPLLDERGEVREWVGLHTDISALRGAEERLRALNDELQQLADQRRHALSDLTRFNTLLLEAAGEGILGLDTRGRAVFINPVAARLLGYPPSALLGQELHGLLHGRHADGRPSPAASSPVLLTLRDGRTRRVVGEVFWTAQGQALPVEYVCTALLEEDGTVQGVVAVFQDVTQRLKAEEHLKAAVAQLERSNLELERSNRDLEQFAYIASHDLQEPLRTLGSYADLLSRRYGDQLDERGRRYLSFLTGGAERMRQLVQDLLSFSRIGQGSVARPEPQQLGAALSRVAALLAVPLERSGARLDARALHASPPPPVNVNALQLEQLLGNLISNAVKFTRVGVPPVVTVRARPTGGADPAAGDDVPGGEQNDQGRSGPGSERGGGPPLVHVTVQDNGIGIEEAYQERVFSLFQRLHRREDYEGTGLGLAICRRIVERAGGRIWLTSQPGEGTTVHFTLPAAPPTVPVPSVPPVPPVPPAAPPG